jgi:two-component system, HptB-dependent secretion and biofilm response regulator
MTDPILKSYTAGRSALYVEDDPVGAAIIKKMLEPFFDRVYGAHDGAEGLRQFHLQQPDLIISDLMMPVMDGITMLREIRKSNQKVPVILMTASLEHVHLVEAINLGVSKFLAKPLRAEALRLALLAVTREQYLEQVAEGTRRQEVELLQFRNRYHSRQQELAKAKEQHIVHNQLEQQFSPGTESGGWLVDLLKQPRDIMSGDSYSVLRKTDDSLLIFLADAMGHGLSASVTSMLTTAFFNHVAKGCACSHLGFPHLVSSTLRFAADNLLEDEVFSCLILELSPCSQKARMACCGMPALLLIRNGQQEKIRGSNPPVSAFSPHLQIQDVDLAGVSDILLATDGLGDVAMTNGGCYRERLADDLAITATAVELFAQYEKQCNDDENDDDVTFIRLTALGTGVGGQQHRFVSPATMAGISHLQQQVREQLEASGADGERLDNLELALSEALMNAFEHGVLKMGANKQRLMQEGDYDDLVMAAVPDLDQQIIVTLTLVPRQGRLQAWCEVADPGPGFNADERLVNKSATTATSGRGFKMMQRSVNLVRRNPAGNRLVLMQMFGEIT